MKKYIYVGIGGFLGAAVRLFMKNIKLQMVFGITGNILMINVIGSFVLSLFLFLTLYKWKINEELKSGVSGGFIGAFTTFSTFCKEAVFYINKNEIFKFIAYTFSSILLGLAAAWLGYVLAKYIENRSNNSIEESGEDVV